MFSYFLPALLVFGIVTNAALQDETTSTTNVGIWLFALVAGFIWPVTLPCILRKRGSAWLGMIQEKLTQPSSVASDAKSLV